MYKNKPVSSLSLLSTPEILLAHFRVLFFPMLLLFASGQVLTDGFAFGLLNLQLSKGREMKNTVFWKLYQGILFRKNEQWYIMKLKILLKLKKKSVLIFIWLPSNLVEV